MSTANIDNEAFLAQTFTGHSPVDFVTNEIDELGAFVVEPLVAGAEPVFYEHQIPLLGMASVTEITYAFGSGDFTNLAVLVGPYESGEETGSWFTLRQFNLFAIQHEVYSILCEYQRKLREDVCLRLGDLLGGFFDPEDWEENASLPNPQSFLAMVRFFSKHPELRPSRLSLSRLGYFEASWRKSRDQLATLQFKPNGIIQWLVFAPPVSDSTVKQRATGESSNRSVLSHIEPFGAFEWMMRSSAD